MVGLSVRRVFPIRAGASLCLAPFPDDPGPDPVHCALEACAQLSEGDGEPGVKLRVVHRLDRPHGDLDVPVFGRRDHDPRYLQTLPGDVRTPGWVAGPFGELGFSP